MNIVKIMNGLTDEVMHVQVYVIYMDAIVAEINIEL